MELLTDLLTVTNILIVLLLFLIGYILYPVVDPHLSHIPGPNPIPLFGNLLFFNKHGFGKADEMCVKKYGNVFRMYLGRQPCIVVSDVEIIKHVLIKDFNHFSDHTRIPFQGIWRKAVFNATGDDWRRLRVMLTPLFTTGKLKKLFPLIKKCAERLARNIESCDENTDFEAKRYSGMFTLDVSASTEFSIDLDQYDPKNPFIENALELFNSFSSVNIPLLVSMFFPFMVKPLEKLGVTLLSKKNHDFFEKLMRKIIKERNSSGKAEVHDMLQHMLDAHTEDLDQESQNEIKNSGLVHVKNTKKAFSETEVLSNALVFFLGAYDTTSSTLAWLLYELSRHPDIQEKIIEEMDSAMGENEEVTYEAVSKMQYLEQCIQETLRMYPPGMRHDRFCDKEITIKGIRIPANTTVYIPAYMLHYNPDVWPEPHKYKPERFHPDEKKKRNPFYYVPFGQGPRGCIGTRLAMTELKLAAMYTLQRFEFIPAQKETKVVFQYMPKSVDGIWVAAKKRQPVK